MMIDDVRPLLFKLNNKYLHSNSLFLICLKDRYEKKERMNKMYTKKKSKSNKKRPNFC